MTSPVSRGPPPRPQLHPHPRSGNKRPDTQRVAGVERSIPAGEGASCQGRPPFLPDPRVAGGEIGSVPASQCFCCRNRFWH